MVKCGYTGQHGEVRINNNLVTVANWQVTIDRDVITSARVGKVADLNCPGKQMVGGDLNQVLVTPELLAMNMGDSDTLTTSIFENLLPAYDLDAGVREEVSIPTNPTDPTRIKVTMTAGSNPTTEGNIVIHGSDISNQYVTEVITLAAMNAGDPAQVKFGTQVFNTTTFVDIEPALGVAGSPNPTLIIDGSAGIKTQTPGNATIFDISGKVSDSAGNFTILTLNNCFFTSGDFPIGDSSTLVSCALPFVISDADVDFSLSWKV